MGRLDARTSSTDVCMENFLTGFLLYPKFLRLSIPCFTMRMRKYFPLTYSSGERFLLNGIQTILVVCNLIQPWSSNKLRVHYLERFAEFSKINGLSVGRKLLNSNLGFFVKTVIKLSQKLDFQIYLLAKKKWFWLTTCACSGEGELASLLVASVIWEFTDDIKIGKKHRPQRHSCWDYIWAHLQI